MTLSEHRSTGYSYIRSSSLRHFQKMCCTELGRRQEQKIPHIQPRSKRAEGSSCFGAGVFGQKTILHRLDVMFCAFERSSAPNRDDTFSPHSTTIRRIIANRCCASFSSHFSLSSFFFQTQRNASLSTPRPLHGVGAARGGRLAGLRRRGRFSLQNRGHHEPQGRRRLAHGVPYLLPLQGVSKREEPARQDKWGPCAITPQHAGKPCFVANFCALPRMVCVGSSHALGLAPFGGADRHDHLSWLH